MAASVESAIQVEGAVQDKLARSAGLGGIIIFSLRYLAQRPLLGKVRREDFLRFSDSAQPMPSEML